MTQPPSFQPRKRRQRPSSQGARRVGKPAKPVKPAEVIRPVAKRNTQAGPSVPRKPQSTKITPPTPPSGGSKHPRGPAGPIRRSAFTPQARENLAGSPQQPPVIPPRTTSTPPPRQHTQQFPQRPPATQYMPAQPGHQQPGHQQPGHQQPGHQQPDVEPGSHPQRKRPVRKLRFYLKIIVAFLLAILVATLLWVWYLFHVGDDRVTHISALTGNADTPGTTYLIVGSDERGGIIDDPTEGHRADTIMLLQVPDSGSTSLISIPRDTLVTYPDGTEGKINASLNFGGNQGLVETVENLTGLTVDHYVQIGMDGVKNLTDAVGGVHLCLDYDVDDPYSTLKWQAGCHDVDGTTALAFSRMRYQDPLGDIGRNARQRQVVSQIINKAATTSTFLNPFKQKELMEAAGDILTIDDNDSLLDVAWAGLALREAMGSDGLMGSPPIATLNYTGYDGASYVLLDDDNIDQFWEDVKNGTVTADEFATF